MNKSGVRIVNLHEFEADLKRFSDALAGEMLASAAQTGAMVIEKHAKLAIQNPPKTGVQYKRGQRMHQASAPGEAPATDMGTLANSIRVSRVTISRDYAEVAVGPSAEYGEALEYGTSRMAPRPYMRPAMDAHLSEIEAAVRGALERGIQQVIKG